MTYQIRGVDYFYTWVDGQSDRPFDLLSDLAEVGISLVAFTAVPAGLAPSGCN